MSTADHTFDELVEQIAAHPHDPRRFVVAIAGPPAAGKSALAAAVAQALPTRVAVVGLDAFHFDNAVLAERSLLDRKGSPATFDVEGYRRCLETLIAANGADVAVPVFDRELELSRNSAKVIPATCDVIVTEGNYLLLTTGEWPSLAPLFDMTVFLDVSMETIGRRIVERWRHYGYSEHDAQVRATGNDIPNAETVVRSSRRADYIMRNP